MENPQKDPATGIELIPGWHGENCPGSGDHPGYECCCDECDCFLVCFPEWDWAPNDPSPGEIP